MNRNFSARISWGLDVPHLLAAWREMTSIRTVPRDLMAGVVIAVVALPLCIAFAVASGVPPAVGLVTGVVGGFLAALLGGSRFSVTGPAAAMAIVLIHITERHGLGGLLTVGFLCGLLQLVAGLARLGKFAQYLPVPVVSGFTSGIGVLIILMQLPNLLGLPKPSPEAELLGWFTERLGDINWLDVGIALVTITAMLGIPRRSKVPAALIAVVAGTAASFLLPLVVSGAVVSRVGPIPRMLPAPGLWAIPWENLGELFLEALAVFALATIESLLCAVSCDGQTGTRHQGNQELIGQGLANLIVPFFGGIPVTGVIVRSSAGIKAGAQTRLAAMAHAVVLLLLMVTLADLAALIPRAALAGILLVTGYRMFEYEMLVRTIRACRLEGAVLVTTLIVTVRTDLILGVAAGLGLSMALFAWKMARLLATHSRPHESIHPDHKVVVHHVEGPLFFGAAPRFVASFDGLHDHDVLVLDLERASTLDVTGCEAIAQLSHRLQKTGAVLLLSGLGRNRKILKRFGTYQVVGPDNCFMQLPAALARANELAADEAPSLDQAPHAA